MNKFFMNRKGFTLITTFVFMLTMALMVTSFLDVNAAEVRELKGRLDETKAFCFAEAGLDKGQWMIMIPPSEGGGGKNYVTPPGGLTESFDEGKYTVIIEKKGNNRTITSTGTYGSLSRTVQQQFKVKEPKKG